MKIAIDARFWGPKGTGLGTYTQKLVENLEEIDNKNQYYILLPTNNLGLYQPKNTNFTKIGIDSSYYSFSEQLKIPITLSKIAPDIVHFCHFNIPIFYRGAFVVTIHDLIKHEFTSLASTTKKPWVYFLKHQAYRYIIGKAVKHSKSILVPSHWVKKRLLDEFNVSQEKINVTYEGSGFEGVMFDMSKLDESKDEYPIQKPFIIYVGNLYPYKNLGIVLKALEVLKKQGTKVSFFVASPRDYFLDQFESEVVKLKLNNQVFTPGYVPTLKLMHLFKKATAYVFPSLSEGFGIPGLDAMTSGLPLISSNIPVLKEIYGSAALYFDPQNSKDLADKISQIIKDNNLKNELVKKGKLQVGKYSWRKMAKQTLTVYNSFAGE